MSGRREESEHAPNARSVLGAVIAGGRSTRYGRPKALVRIGGQRLLDRVVAALGSVTPDVVLIANDAELAAEADLPWRSDAIEGLGALGGIHAALRWALELGRPGVLAVACDMPFLDARLLAHLLDVARSATPPPDVVVPTSGGRRGIEPLCAFYGTGCLPAIERAIERDDRRMIGFHEDVRVARIPRDVVARITHPDRAFLNVNTMADRDAAERMLESVAQEAERRDG